MLWSVLQGGRRTEEISLLELLVILEVEVIVDAMFNESLKYLSLLSYPPETTSTSVQVCHL